jgi:3-oxoacyl-[acyl-carrier protein] reductase
MNSLKGKLAIVTGGARGIGKAIALALSKEGVNLGLVSTNETNLNATKKEIEAAYGVKVIVFAADISKPENVDSFSELVHKTLGPVHILVNNAAGWLNGMLEDTSIDEIHQVIDSTVKAPIWMCRRFWPDLKAAKPGHIINITTLGVRPNRSNATPIYVGAKSGLTGFGEALRRLGIREDIRVTEIQPGSVASEMPLDGPDSDVEKKYGNARVPNRDIADAVIFALTRSKFGMVEDISIPSVGDWFEDWVRYPKN